METIFFIVWLILGFSVGLFINFLSLSPILFLFPGSIIQFRNKQKKFGRGMLAVGAVWLIVIGILAILITRFAPSLVDFLFSHPGFSGGWMASLIAVGFSGLMCWWAAFMKNPDKEPQWSNMKRKNRT